MQAEGRKLFELISGAVQEYLRASVRDTPTLILVEDMHWFDEDTVEAVQLLLGADLGGHVMIVMTSRDHVPLPDGSAAEVFELGPLSGDATEQLITALHPDATADREARGEAPLRRCTAVHRGGGRQAQGPAVGRRDHGRGARHALRGAVRAAAVQ